MRRFALYSNCIIVEGDTEDLICDLFRSRTMPLKKRISNIIQEHLSSKTVEEIIAQHPEWKEGLNKYLNFLVENDFGFYPDDPDRFPKLNLEYDSPFHLETCVIHISSSNNIDYIKLLERLLQRRWRNFQLIFSEAYIDTNSLKDLIALFDESDISAVEILMNDNIIKEEQFKQLTDNKRIAFKVYGISNQKRENINWDDEPESLEMVYFMNKELALDKKEIYHPDLFNINITSFTEAQKHNVGLNKSVTIDAEGNYKNHINHKETFGNIATTSISQLIENKAFTRKWFISNDKIQKCKDCQFKYICFSSSDLIEKNGKIYKADDCNFDPYTNTWSKAVNNLTKKKAVTH